jgi:hypothetical protein
MSPIGSAHAATSCRSERPDANTAGPGPHWSHVDRQQAAVIVFVTTAGDLGTPETASALGAGQRDALAWVAYPKGGQRGTDLNRDILAARLADRGVRAVRQVSIDDTWSALRFRPST